MTDSTNPPDIDIEALTAVAEKATPGPWSASRHCGPQVCTGKITEDTPSTLALEKGAFLFTIEPGDYLHANDKWSDGRCLKQARADAAFIAAFNPQTALALLSELRRLRAQPEVSNG